MLTGEITDRAVRLHALAWTSPTWMLGVPGFATVLRLVVRRDSEPVTLPVGESMWRRWSRRNAAAIALAAFAIGIVATGVARAATGAIVAGIVLGVVALVYRARAARNYWVTCRLTDTDTIVVEPTHPDFDRAAQAMFARSIGLP